MNQNISAIAIAVSTSKIECCFINIVESTMSIAIIKEPVLKALKSLNLLL